MNATFKKDIDKILKIYKKTNKESIKKECVNDLIKIRDIISDYFPLESSLIIPSEMKELCYECEKKNDENNEMIQKQIIDNSTLLKNIYDKVIDSFKNYNLEWVECKGNEDDFNLGIYSDFLKNYPGFFEIFTKILKDNHLVFIDNSDDSFCYRLMSTNEEYIFLCLDDIIMSKAALAHEIGHVYQNKITFDVDLKEYNLLDEFTSILMELLFIDYYFEINKSESEYMVMNGAYIWEDIFKCARAQLELLDRHDDAFENFEVNEKYSNEFNEICNSESNGKDDLYIHFYTIGFLCAISFFYLLKYGIDFNEVDKFFIKNNESNNLTKILKNDIDLGIFNQYLRDYITKNKNKVRKKK